MRKDHLSDAELEALFAEARADAPLPSADLLSRVLAGADAALAEQQAARNVAVAPVPAPVTARPWARLMQALGGWPVATGLVTAAVAGLGFGLFLPDNVSQVAQSYYAGASYDDSYVDAFADLGEAADPTDLAPSFDQLLTEG